jgi:protein phosphatase
MVQIVHKCDIGNIRDINQDYVKYLEINENEALLVVCDGMGGHAGGEVASQLTGDYIIDHFSMHSEFSSEEDIKQWMHTLIHNANQLVYENALKNDSLKGMGTTVAFVYIKDSIIYIAHVGDSRVYLIDETIEQVTSDDTLVNALVKNGTISKQEARFHPQKNILLQAVGVSSPLNISFYIKELQNQRILMCSDGLYNSLTDQNILDIFHSYSKIDSIADELLSSAKRLGGYDNIGFIIVEKGECE